ncbi:MAG: DUF559 domain-containing protein [Bryobacteraceae bacterium]
MIFPEYPSNHDAIDALTLALAKHVLDRQLQNSVPKDRWQQAAFDLIAAGIPPIPTGYAAETNVDRLMLWVNPSRTELLVGSCASLDEEQARQLRRIAEWTAQATARPTVLVLAAKPSMPLPKPAAPRSTLEQQLAARLDQDAELRDLFVPNVRVLTALQTNPRVDFVWHAGRFIVEIDSYHFHSGRESFSDDRQRDYETLASGYVTLRLTENEAETDWQLAIQKIKRIVNLRRRLIHA